MRRQRWQDRGGADDQMGRPYLLFDVDGTLIGHCPPHGRSMLRGLQRFFSLDVEDFGFAPAGMTDWGILRDCAVANGVDEERFERSRMALFEWIEADFTEHAVAADVALLAEVNSALDWVREAGLPAGLLTGNLESVAWHKMTLAGVRGCFAGGGFGCQALERFRLVHCARERASRDGIDAERIVIIGDTPRDIAAARGAGVPCISVATGPYSRDELGLHGPDILINDLSELPAALDALR